MTAVQHFGMNCINRIEQERFYTKHLGFRRARVFNAGTPTEVAMLRLGDMCLELFPTPAGTTARGGEQTVGFKHLAFEVDDIETKIRELQADGVKTDPIIDCSSLIPNMRICFFNDPEGNILEIMEGWKDQDSPPELTDF